METLEFHETILKKVSFDEELLKIELKRRFAIPPVPNNRPYWNGVVRNLG